MGSHRGVQKAWGRMAGQQVPEKPQKPTKAHWQYEKPQKMHGKQYVSEKGCEMQNISKIRMSIENCQNQQPDNINDNIPDNIPDNIAKTPYFTRFLGH